MVKGLFYESLKPDGIHSVISSQSVLVWLYSFIFAHLEVLYEYILHIMHVWVYIKTFEIMFAAGRANLRS